MIQTSPNKEVQPTKAIMGAGVRKIPEPMIRLITIATDSFSPRSLLYSVIMNYLVGFSKPLEKLLEQKSIYYNDDSSFIL